MDPLSVLRECQIKSKATRLEGDRIILGDSSFPRTAETSWRALKGKKDRYRLDSVWLLLKNKDIEYAAYSKIATDQRIPLVSLVDKRDLVSYLTGETSTNAAIDSSFDALVTPTAAPVQKHTIPAGTDDRSAKKQKPETQTPVAATPAAATAPAFAPVIATPAAPEQQIIMVPTPTAISSSERQLRSRTSILECPSADFSRLTESFKTILRKEAMEQKINAQKQMAERKKAAVRHDVYEASDEKQLWKAKLQGTEAEELGIDTRGTFAAPSAAATPVPAPAPAPKHSDKARKPTSGSSGKPVKPSADPKQPNRTPIIIVSSAPTAHITLYNVKQFLEDGVYVSSEEIKNSGAKKESTVIIQRTTVKGQPAVPYEVIDNPSRLTDKDWHRVMGVFALGAAWQFKGWYWTTPTDIFAHVKGYYLQYEDEHTPDLIKQWSVQVIKISRSKRHLDATATLVFWQRLDEFVARNPKLHFLRLK